MERRVEPEILDSLSPDDPAALRGRRDLRWINQLMANAVWMERALVWGVERTGGPVWELGAGEGVLLDAMAERGVRATGVDLAGRPEGMPEEIGWRQGDVLEVLRGGVQGVVAANLFLHHLEDGQLRELGRLVAKCGVLCFSEPWRSRWALLEARLLWPFVGPVTRHDMVVSIRAGFRKGELPRLLGLDRAWEIREECTMLGAYRLLAWRAG